MGGEIIVTHLSGNSYEVRLTYYRDATTPWSAMLSRTQRYIVRTADVNGYPSVVYDSTGVLHINPSLGTTLLPNAPYDVEVGVYTDTVQLPAGRYWFSTEDCARNEAIQNMAAYQCIGLVTEFTAQAAGTNNSSPRFLAAPVPFLGINIPAAYNPLPYDPDGDSLVWTLCVPKKNTDWSAANPTNLGASVDSFTPPPGAAGHSFALNPVSGSIRWTPNRIGHFVQSFQVEEYRNGVKIGSVMRDFQYIVLAFDPNTIPSVHYSANVRYNATGNYYFIPYTAGQPLTFSVTKTVNNVLTPLEMTAHSALFEGTHQSGFSVSGSSGNISGTVQWTPPAGFQQTVPVVLRTKNGASLHDFTIVLKPTGATAVQTPVQTKTQLYPNPSDGTFQLEFAPTVRYAQVNLLNAVGQQIKCLYRGAVTGSRVFPFKEDLAKGFYLLSIQTAERQMEILSLIIE